MASTNLSPPLILLLISLVYVTSSTELDSDILLKFKQSLVNNAALSNWNASKSPCSHDTANWAGILCNNGTVWGLKLENMGLKGTIDVDSLKELSSLRTISFMNNHFDISLPNFKKLVSLKSMYLTNNKFSGEIPGNAFDGMLSLKKIHLGHNQFSGRIPSSLTVLPKVSELMLEENRFQGQIPDFRQQRLQLVNVSNNNLEGPIPASLSKMNASSFSGNKNLCGLPLESCSSSPKLSVVMIVVIAIVVAAALAAIAAAVIILRRRRQPPQLEKQPSQLHKRVGSAELDRMEQGSPDCSSLQEKKAEVNGKLSFLMDDRERFELGDLLKASAEILGSGVFGSTYKAALTSSGRVMVVKRYRQMNNVGKEEFQEHMRRLGRLRHPNLLPLVAFYYRKEEKLLVSDYVDNVSLAIHLHGNRNRAQPSLDWPTRLKIMKGVARGVSYLYNGLPSLIAPHGHLKSSNVLLNQSSEPLLTDYGLVPIINQEHAQDLMIAYKSPEYQKNSRITKKTDVWSFGILILEILTGKFPTSSLQQGKGSANDLETWVHSVVGEEISVEVFDKEMGGAKHSEGEMIKLLKIGLSCCEADVEKRLDIKEVVEKIEELRENDEEFYSSI